MASGEGIGDEGMGDGETGKSTVFRLRAIAQHLNDVVPKGDEFIIVLVSPDGEAQTVATIPPPMIATILASVVEELNSRAIDN
jgi:hypothetical protein